MYVDRYGAPSTGDSSLVIVRSQCSQEMSGTFKRVVAMISESYLK